MKKINKYRVINNEYKKTYLFTNKKDAGIFAEEEERNTTRPDMVILEKI